MLTKREIETGRTQFEELHLAKDAFVNELVKFWKPYVEQVNEAMASLIRKFNKK